MKEYDSILKEKKKYEEPTPKKEKGPKRFPWLQLDILLIILVLIISYIIYYTTILSAQNIFLNDLKIISEKYLTLFKYLELEELEKDFNIEGTINLDSNQYNYGIIKNEDKTKINLSLNDKSLTYYTVSNDKYINIPSYKEEYLKLTGNNYINSINNLNNLEIEENNFIKKFYLDGTTPIVESNLTLNNEQIKSILNLNNLKNSYEALFTFKNNAITNNIISLKITINNLTTNNRYVITYENGIINYKDDNQNLKFQLEKKEEDFTLKIYQEDTLFSVLTGTKQSTNYQYMYQIIDKIYNIKVNVKKIDSNYTYELESNIENNKKNMTVTLNYKDNIILENTDINYSINYSSLSKEEKDQYKASLEELTNNLRELIDEY